MIRAIQRETELAVGAMRAGNTEVEAGIALADRAGAALERIVDGTTRTIDMVAQIAAATEEQSTTAEQMARSVELISTVSNESASGIAGIARSAEGLDGLTGELHALVQHFRVDAAASGAPLRLGARGGDGRTGQVPSVVVHGA